MSAGRWQVRRRGRLHASVLLFYLALTVVMTWPLTPQFFTAIPGDSFDGWQNYWNLWWVKLALVDRLQNPFFTDILYAPTGVGLYFHTLNPFNGLVTLPVQLVAGLIPAYNVVVFVSWTLAGYGVFLLTLYLAGGAQTPPRRAIVVTAAFIGGAIFTFSPFHMAHLLGHMQVMSLQWIPFYILYLLRGVDAAHAGRTWTRPALMAGFFLVLTGLCDWYFVLYLLLFTGLFILWRGVKALALAWRMRAETGFGPAAIGRTLWRTVGPPALAGLVFGVVLSPVLAPMLQEVRAFSFMVRPATDLFILSASLMDFLVPNRLHTAFRPESFGWIGNQIAPVSEKTIAIGYAPLLLACAGLWLDRKRALWWLTVAVFFVLMAMGPHLHVGNITWAQIPQAEPEEALRTAATPFGLMNQLVPLVRHSRSVSRYALMVQLAIAVAAGIGLAALLARRRPRRAPVYTVGAGVLLLVMAEFWVAPYPMSPPDTPEYYTRLHDELPPGAVLNLPMNWDRPGYLLYQTVHQRPLTVAYISREDPRTMTERYPVLQHLRHLGPDILRMDPAQVGMTVLGDLGVGVVTLDRYKMPGGAERDVTEAIAALVFGEAIPHFEDHRITVYAVEPVVEPVPYLALGPLHWGALETAEEPDAHDDEATVRSRRVGSDQATILAYHTRPGSIVEAVVAGSAGTVLEVETQAGDVQTYALAQEPQTLRFALEATDVSVQEIRLRGQGGEVIVYALDLVYDQGP